MLGTTGPQPDLFDVGNVYDLALDPKTFYSQLALAAEELFDDEVFAALYHDKLGRPGVPPSKLALMTLMQQYDGCSDEEAVNRSAYDLRWCAVLRKVGGKPLCAKSTFQEFRAHLVLHGEVRKVFQASIAEAKRKGLLKQGTTLRLLLDTKPVLGRGAVLDTYNLLGTGIVLLSREMARAAWQPVKEWAGRNGFERYFGKSLKGSAEIDWSNEAARDGFLSEIVNDVRRLLGLAAERASCGELDKERAKKIAAAAALLERLLLQDIKESVDGQGKPAAEVKKGTAKDRIPSVSDPEQRHGHKSKSKKFTGHKAAIGVDAATGLILCADVPEGNAPDAKGALEQVEQAEENTGEKVGETTADCAYGDGETRKAFEDAGRDFAAKVPAEAPNQGRYPKSKFQLDLKNDTVSCPGGQTTGDYHRTKNGGKIFQFGERCQGCPLREQCTQAAHGRQIAVHPQEAMRAKARAYQETAEGRERLRARVGVEHGLARLSHLGIGQARYRGRGMTLFQLMMAASVANLRRTWNWVAAGGESGEEGSKSKEAAPKGAQDRFLAGLAGVCGAIWRQRRWGRALTAGTPHHGGTLNVAR